MNPGRLKILIVGGYGTFGGRLAMLLAPDPRVTLIIGGRSLAKAQKFIAGLPKGAEALPMVVDREADPGSAVSAIAPDIVVDATGPFQAYGEDPYRLVRAAIGAGANYLDLADGSDFVEGIGAFDNEARSKGLFVLSGVSSFPVLTAAVVRIAARDIAQIDTVTGGIAPSPYAGIGLNVIRAITHYSGQPIRLFRSGRIETAYALTESRRYTIAPPGRLPLKNTHFSLVEVPDLILIPRAFPGIASMWMGAGPVPEILHRVLNLLSWLVRWRVLPTIAPLASLCSWAINTIRWGEHRGGMFIDVVGRDGNGRAAHRSWHLLAEGSDGPFIPSMAIAAIVLKMLEGTAPEPGARPATTGLELADYDRMFADRTIYWGWRDDAAPFQTLYEGLLGDAWEALPPTIRHMHDVDGTLTVRGRADVETGAGFLAKLIRRLMGLPNAGNDVPVTVAFEARDGVETWRRTFGGQGFASTQQAGRGRSDRLLVEGFGPVSVSLALVVSDATLRLIVRRWSIFGMPLPLLLAPRGDIFEFERDGRFHFHVEMTLPVAGLIVRYAGWLEPEMPPKGPLPRNSGATKC